MAGLEPPTLPFDEVAERYEQSGRYLDDALLWASVHGDTHAKYCDLVMDLYRDSAHFSTTVNDICDGVDELDDTYRTGMAAT
jgi:hypothetical protein